MTAYHITIEADDGRTPVKFVATELNWLFPTEEHGTNKGHVFKRQMGAILIAADLPLNGDLIEKFREDHSRQWGL